METRIKKLENPWKLLFSVDTDEVHGFESDFWTSSNDLLDEEPQIKKTFKMKYYNTLPVN
jgi:hypothetical protein